MHEIAHKIRRLLIRPDIMFFSMMWLIVILIIGTVAQKYIGLYRAQHLFFDSWILWWGPFPLPGGLLVLTLIALSLTVKTVTASRWSAAKAGTIITHIGALLLLVGGLVTSLFSTEGSMVIYEGQTSNFVTDYHARELVVYAGDTDQKLLAVPQENLKIGKTYAVVGTPLRIEITQTCRNCDIVPRAVPENDPSLASYKSRAKTFDMTPAALAKEDEMNKAGVQFRVTGADTDANGIYFSVDFIDEMPRVTVGGKTYRIGIQKRHTYLPFSIQLTRFDREVHPGTDIARRYRSDIVLKDGATAWKSVVQMNEPLRYKGYTFYQSSFIDDGKKAATVFAVVKNVGRVFPYISGIVMCIGLLVHLLMKLPPLVRNIMQKRVADNAEKGGVLKSLFILLLGITLLGPSVAQAAPDTFDYSAFDRIPILDQGRVKPLSTFAQTYLKIVYGSASLPDMSASAWLAELLCRPDKAYERKIFNIADPRIVDELRLDHRMPHLYSYNEVGAGIEAGLKDWRALFAKPQEDLTPSEKELLETYNKAQMIGDLSRSLSLLFPVFRVPEGAVAKTLHLPAGRYTYMDMTDHDKEMGRLAAPLLTFLKKKGTHEGLSRDKATVLDLVQLMQIISQDQDSRLFQVIPPQWEEDKIGKPWFSPWGITQQGQGSPDSLTFIGYWKELVAAYRIGDAGEWKDATQKINAMSLRMAQDAAPAWKMKLEVASNNLRPQFISTILYGIAFALVLASLLVWRQKLYVASATTLVAAAGFHGAGLVIRMLIMGRPPVTNIYASIIFVAVIVVLVGLAYEWRMRNRIGLIAASSAGVVLQFIGLKYDTDGDTMNMLVAVLDTNFWLSTHVVCITIGYACCVLDALLAHIYLVLRMARPAMKAQATEISRNVQGISYLALFFTAIGTILGGIWADQSWGRFWGWDPKENGALLIVLWLLLVTHGRLAGRLGELGFNIGMALTNICVALAWFGVNLLAVGLHSYGFTTGAATGLALFVGGEVLFAGISYGVVRICQKKASSS